MGVSQVYDFRRTARSAGTAALTPSHSQVEKMSIGSCKALAPSTPAEKPALSTQRKALGAFAVPHGALFFAVAGC
jgi:hypothetical protein